MPLAPVSPCAGSLDHGGLRAASGAGLLSGWTGRL